MNKNEEERFLEMQEHPENYTEEQLSATDVQQTADALAQLKRAMVSKQQAEEAVDAEAAWQDFAVKHIPSTHHRLWWRNVAAVFAGLVIVGLAYAAAVRWNIAPNFFAHKESVAVVVEKENVQQQSKDKVEPTTVSTDTLSTKTQTDDRVIYDNATLASMLADFSTYYNIKVEYVDEELKSIRLYYQWNKMQTLEQSVAALNGFERFHITVENGSLTVEQGGKEVAE